MLSKTLQPKLSWCLQSYTIKCRGIFTLPPELSRFLQTPPKVQTLTLMYSTFIYFHIPPSVRILYEILMDPATCAAHVTKFLLKDIFTPEHVYKHP